MTSSPFSSLADDAALARIDAVVAAGTYAAIWDSLRRYLDPLVHERCLLDPTYGHSPCYDS